MKKFSLTPETQKKLFAAAAGIVILGAGFTLYRNITNEPVPNKVIPLVRTVTVGESITDSSVVYPGEVRGRYESQLSFQVAGRINARFVNVGDHVSQGQVLMTLDPRDVHQTVANASAALASAQANQKLAADNAARYNALYASGAVSESVRDQYNTQLEAADASLRQALAQVNTSVNQLEYTRLTSDADGVVSSLSGEVGQVAAIGTVMAVVVRSGEREIQINVPENVQLRIGQRAAVTFWALPGITAAGSIREISPVADSTARTYKVCVAVPEFPDAAKLGMTAKVSFDAADSAESAGDHFTIPASALYQINNKTQVWIVRDRRAQLADVEIAGYIGNNVAIASGLSAGDIVITAGLSKLTPEQEVRLAEGGEQ